MNTNVGAAFDAATLITFQADGLDAAAFYQATDTDARPGGWGTVTLAGRRRPSWSTFRLWHVLAPVEVALGGAQPNAGLWAIASRDRSRRRLTVMLASFSVASPQARTVVLAVRGLRRGRLKASVLRIDATHERLRRPSRLRVARGGRVAVALPPQAVAFVTITVRRRRGR